MTFENLITLALVVGFGYMMFKGGGCCGSHGGHGKNDEKEKEPEVGAELTPGDKEQLKDVTPDSEEGGQKEDASSPVKGSCCH